MAFLPIAQKKVENNKANDYMHNSKKSVDL